MYDVIYIDAQGSETPVAQHMDDKAEATDVARAAAAERGAGRMVLRVRAHFRCWARCLFISNMVTLSLPNTLRSLSSARISRRFSGFCRLLDLM